MSENLRRINPGNVHEPTGYSHVVEVAGGRLAYVSGQVAIDPAGNIIGAGDMRAQAVQVFENLNGALAALGADFSDVVKLNYYATDASQVAAVRDVRAQYIDAANPPASTFVVVAALVRPEFLLEVEAVVSLP